VDIASDFAFGVAMGFYGYRRLSRWLSNYAPGWMKREMEQR